MPPRPQDISPCPACGETRFAFRFTKKGRDFWRCTRCGLEKQHPLPSLAELKAYYDAAYADGMYKTFTDADEMKRMTAARRYREIAPRAIAGHWLDVGCANGVFMAHAAAQGHEVSGIDLSDVAVAQAREKGLDATCTTIADYAPGRTFDTITGFDVLEHVLDPGGFLDDARRLIAPDGRLFLTVPDTASIIRKVMGSRWYFYIPEEHLHYYDPSTIRLILARHGFEAIRVSRTFKPISYAYALTQFREYNPLIFKLLNAAGALLPRALKERPVPLYIGEMMVTARPANMPMCSAN